MKDSEKDVNNEPQCFPSCVLARKVKHTMVRSIFEELSLVRRCLILHENKGRRKLFIESTFSTENQFEDIGIKTIEHQERREPA